MKIPSNNCKSPEVVTFGCRLNLYESEIIYKKASEAGITNAVIFNTCAVTTEAEKQARNYIQKIKKKNPNVRIIVSGCAAQINPTNFQKMPEVDLILGNQEKLLRESYQETGKKNKVLVSNIMQTKKLNNHLINNFRSHSRAFVQIQQGCNHRCTYCIIPFGRGNSRSHTIDHIANQIRELINNGYREVVLTGVDISSYGQDLPEPITLGKMIKKLLYLLPDMDRLRLSSLDPGVIDRELFDVIANDERVMPHIHLSVQSGSNLILKRMKRRHNREDVVALCNEIRNVRPGIILGADLITGFPTETDKLFNDTIKLIRESGLTYLHIFPFSPRPGTPASKMPQLNRDIIKNRATILREIGEKSKQKYYETLTGKVKKILVESNNRGYTETFAPVQLDKNVKQGEIVEVLITEYNAEGLQGTITSNSSNND